jgi:ribosomal protein L4
LETTKDPKIFIIMVSLTTKKIIYFLNQTGGSQNTSKIMVVKSERKKPFGRYRRRRIDKVKIDLTDYGNMYSGFTWFNSGTSVKLL